MNNCGNCDIDENCKLNKICNCHRTDFPYGKHELISHWTAMTVKVVMNDEEQAFLNKLSS